MNPTVIKIIQWLGFVLYAVALVDSQKWLDIPLLDEQIDVYVMIGAAILAFFFANPIKWLGLSVFLIGLALHYKLLLLNLENVQFSPIWIMLTGYLTLFSNAK